MERQLHAGEMMTRMQNLAIGLTLLMLFSTLGVTGSMADADLTLTPEQQALPWENHAEVQRVYITDNAGTFEGTLVPCENGCDGGADELLGETVLADWIQPLDELQVSSFSGQIVVQFDNLNIDNPAGIRIEALHDGAVIGSDTIDADGSLVGGANSYIDVGGVLETVEGLPFVPEFVPKPEARPFAIVLSSPVTIETGEQISFQISGFGSEVQSTGQATARSTAFLEHGSTYIDVLSSSANVKLWTESKDGDLTNVYSDASTVNAANRKVYGSFVQANAFGADAMNKYGPGNNRDLSVSDISITDENGAAVTSWVKTTTFRGAAVDGHKITDFQLVYPANTPNGEYVLKLDAKDWQQTVSIVIGGAEFGMVLDQYDSASKLIKTGESTKFRYEITNIGPSKDDALLSFSGLANGWTAVLSQTTIAGIGAGNSATFELTVTPGPSAIAPDSEDGVVTVTSARSGETTDLNFAVTLTNAENYDVTLNAPSAAIEIGPGQTRRVPIVIGNDATVEDTFVSSAGNVPLGWLARLDPAIMTSLAKSQDTVFFTITAPTFAVPGSTFDVLLKTQRLDDVLVQDSVLVPIKIIAEDDHELKVITGTSGGEFTYTQNGDTVTHKLRDEGPGTLGAASSSTNPFRDTNAERDMDYDDTTLFRVTIENTGDLPDIIDLDAKWTGSGFSSGCDGNNGPDNWRLASWTGPVNRVITATPDPHDYNGLALGPGEEVTVYYEMKWSSFDVRYASNGNNQDSCNNALQGRIDTSGNTDVNIGARERSPDPEAKILLTSTSRNDPTVIKTATIVAQFDEPTTQNNIKLSSQRYNTATHGVLVASENGLERQVDVTGANPRASYMLTGINTGNEMDAIRFTIPTQKDGWDMAFGAINEDLAFQNDLSHALEQNPPATPPVGCVAIENVGNSLLLDCLVGSYDEISVEVTATPTGSVVIGDKLSFVASVASVDSLTDGVPGTKLDSLTLNAEATGAFLFDLLPNPAQNLLQVEATPGEPVFVPFSIQNLGTQDDTFLVQFSQQPTGDNWQASLSHLTDVFVPAGRIVNGYAVITAGSLPDGTTERFQIKATSQGTNALSILDVDATVTVRSQNYALSGDPGFDVVAPGQEAEFAVKASRAAGTAAGVTFEIVDDYLPATWTVTPTGSSTINYDSNDEAKFTVTIQTSTLDLASDRVSIPVKATDSDGNVRYYYGLVTYTAGSTGLQMAVLDETRLLVPGGAANFTATLTNAGNSVESIGLSATAVPTGWSVEFDRDQLSLQPLESTEITGRAIAPLTAAPGDQRVIIIEAASLTDANVVTDGSFEFTLGDSDLTISGPSTEFFAAPTETITFPVSIANSGSVADFVSLSEALPTVYGSLIDTTYEPASVRLDPGESVDVTVTFDIPTELASNLEINYGYRVASDGPLLANEAVNFTKVTVLAYKAMDVDFDLFNEYAIDRDRNPSNGFEDFLDVEGNASKELDMSVFLNNESRAGYTVTEIVGNETIETFTFIVDGDGDGRVDKFIDTNNNGLPDVYWNPVAAYIDTLQVTKDVTGDGIREYFIDLENDGRLDVFYDITTGVFGNLIAIDVDDNGEDDYGVDLNGNGELDDNEPVFFTGGGKVVRIEERKDVDGDGKLDLVIDEDGDGIPDRFIPNGKTNGIRIILKDINGDGIDDWTYDADGDGKRESYFDPATGQAGVIDTSENFSQLLKDYWYVGALFLLVAVLFVVLLAVTRRG